VNNCFFVRQADPRICDRYQSIRIYNIVSRRHGQRATIITTNLAFKQWGTVFAGAACVAALVDRSTSTATRSRSPLIRGARPIRSITTTLRSRRSDRGVGSDDVCYAPVMSPAVRFAGVACVIALFGCSKTDEIEYHGQKFKMSRAYASYEEYKNDPNNLRPEDAPRIEQAMTNAKLERRYRTYREAVRAVFDVHFPGYAVGGVGGGDPSLKPADQAITGHVVEIPLSGKNRYLVFRKIVDGYELIDDFVAHSQPGTQAATAVYVSDDIAKIELHDGELVYSNNRGVAVLRRRPSAP
jgi:hypothetical protein